MLKSIQHIFILLAATPFYFASAAEIDSIALVTAHNKWRAEVGIAEKLNYSPELAASAQAWANTLKTAHRCQLRHSNTNGQYGENIFWASPITWSDGRVELPAVTPVQVVNSWGSERQDYEYAYNDCAPGKACGHYTQIIWRNTATVGCAMAVCDDTQEQVWVCQYQPAGNWVGLRPY